MATGSGRELAAENLRSEQGKDEREQKEDGQEGKHVVEGVGQVAHNMAQREPVTTFSCKTSCAHGK